MALVLTLIGLVVIRLARMTAPSGERRCGRCDYVLFPPAGEKCPECRTPSTQARMTQVPLLARGPRIAMWCIGIFLCACGLFFAIMALWVIWVRIILGIKG